VDALAIVTLMAGDTMGCRFRARRLSSPRSGAARAAWSILTASIFVSGAALVAFHAWLLWDRLIAGSLFEPEIALRWTAAAVLTALLVWLRRMGVPLTHGRKALSVWLLVVLLHLWGAGAPQPALEAFGPGHGASDASALFVLPVVAGALAVSLALLVTSARAPRATASPRPSWLLAPSGGAIVHRIDPGPSRAPRPPPLASA
jgi:hypothetical protein